MNEAAQGSSVGICKGRRRMGANEGDGNWAGLFSCLRNLKRLGSFVSRVAAHTLPGHGQEGPGEMGKAFWLNAIPASAHHRPEFQRHGIGGSRPLLGGPGCQLCLLRRSCLLQSPTCKAALNGHTSTQHAPCTHLNIMFAEMAQEACRLSLTAAKQGRALD